MPLPIDLGQDPVPWLRKKISLPSSPSRAPSAPAATAFFGVDRTTDAQRLGGIRFAADSDTHGTIENAFIAAAAECDLAGGSPSHIFMNSIDYSQFVRELGDKRVYTTDLARTEKGALASVGFKGIEIAAAGGKNGGSVKVFSDRDCPQHRACMLQLDTWTLKSLNDLSQWLSDDCKGNVFRMTNADAYEGQLGGYYQLGCEAPGYNVTIDLTELTAA